MRSLRKLLLLAVSAAVLTAASPALSQQAQPSSPWVQDQSDVPVDTAVRFGTLPNGMRYAIMHNATPPERAAFRLHLDAGSLMENDDQRGLAHFMEHMAFNGTTNIPENELLAILERLGLAFGADTNAQTGYDQTNYILELPRTNDETVDTAMRIMREQVSEALMAPESIDEERGVIAGEERLRNTPSSRAAVAQLNLLAPGQRLSQRFPIGDMNVIRTAPRERFVEFYNSYYRPSRATFIAVGDFDVDAMEAKIKAVFSDWAPKGPDGGDPDLGQPQPRTPTAAAIVEPGLMNSISLFWTSPARNLPDTLANRKDETVRSLALKVLNRRLGELSRIDNPPFLTASAAEDDLVSSLHVAGVSVTFIEGRWKPAIERVEQEYRRFVQYGVSEEELQREISTLRTALEGQVAGAATRQTPGLANQILNGVNEDEVVTSPRTDLELFNAAVDGLTAERVNAVIPTVFVGDGPLALSMSPKPIEGGEAALTAALEASRQMPVERLTPPPAKSWDYTDFGPPGAVVEREELTDLGATRVTFANGTVLIVKSTDFDEDSVSFSVRTGIGEQAFSPAAWDPRLAMFGTIRLGGLGRMTMDEVTRALTGHTYSLSGGVGEDSLTFNGGARPEDLELSMQLLTAYLTDAAFRSTPFELQKVQYPMLLEMQRSMPAGVFGLEVSPLIKGGDRRDSLVPPELLETWSVDDNRDALKDMLARGPLRVTVVGDVTVDEAIRVTATTLGALPARLPAPAPAPGADQRHFAAPTPTPLQFTHAGPADQAMAFIGWPTTGIGADRTEARQLDLLAKVIRLQVLEEIRERQALAYSPSAGSQASQAYKDYGYISISAQIAPDKIDAFYAASESIIAGMRDRPVSQDLLDRAREPELAGRRRSRANNTWWWLQLASLNDDPNQRDQILDDISDIEAVTPADLQALAQKYLRPETAFKAVVVPEPK